MNVAQNAVAQKISAEDGASSLMLRFGATVVLTLRALLFSFIILMLDDVVELGTSPAAISLAAFAGVALAARSARSNLRTRGAFLGALLAAIGYYLLSAAIVWVASFSSTPLSPYSFTQHSDLLVAALIGAFLSTWCVLRYEATVTCEALAISLIGIYLVSGHRNFHFEMPKAVNELAWNLGIGNLAALILIGALLTVLLLFYLHLAALPWPEYRRSSKIRASLSPYQPRFPALLALLLVGGSIIFGISRTVHGHYQLEAISRTSNGVGDRSGEGLSPLGFHSALGSTNQPAGLVRLEGDYKENPFSPMLYLREMALSEFNGHEIVQAGAEYDQDVSKTKPEEAFTGQADVELTERTPVNQSIYTLADHQTAFAIDYPLSLVRLKNPNPARFKSAYRAYSMAPAFSLESLQGLPVGDPRWDEKARAHYLVPHKDPRYADLARELTKDLPDSSPIAKAAAITAHLTKTAIYTLTPNHEVKSGEDPVAPFLFGDHRGYCVHFAHATVYMLRAIGIPARIGTGYLSDLSQSKDGHILLRMADRHAWAEVYVAGRGWVPFDVQPEQVESHGDLQVDMKMLEELMGMIDPGEEILPKDSLKDEANVVEPSRWEAPDARMVLSITLLLLTGAMLLKAYLRWGWFLARNPGRRLRYSYLALASLLQDLGVPRNLAETRSEFSHRAENQLKFSPRAIGDQLVKATYAARPLELSVDQIDALRRSDWSEVRAVPRWKRALAFFNPASLLTLLKRGGW